ncbi:hypothetical protein HJFPF1_13639 [Paramyrothecium foliicola]|nr:hypothetical protein HJFPF1_13639 [Paramyrothecium foliicola]
MPRTNIIPKPHSGLLQPKRPMFAVGASCSLSDESPSSDFCQSPKSTSFEKFAIQAKCSSKDSLNLKRPALQFKDEVEYHDAITCRIGPTKVLHTDYVDESAIDDDDSSDWVDSAEDSELDEDCFRRNDSIVNLGSHRSLITVMLENARKLSNRGSQSTSDPRIPSLSVSPGYSTHIIEEPQYNTRQLQTALSPRTTRRNMVATELTESLRRNLLWERQQKSSTANAVLRRRHTAHDVVNLKQFPQKHCVSEKDDNDVSDWCRYFKFHEHYHNGFHERGW